MLLDRSRPGRLRGPHFVVPNAPAEARVRTVVDQVEVPDDSDAPRTARAGLYRRGAGEQRPGSIALEEPRARWW